MDPSMQPSARPAPAATIALLVLQGFVATAVFLLAALQQLSFDRCVGYGVRCDYQLGFWALLVVPVLGILFLIGAIVLVILRVRRRRPSWWIPAVGIGATIVLELVYSAVLTHATGG
jgi:hypothetical protein